MRNKHMHSSKRRYFFNEHLHKSFSKDYYENALSIFTSVFSRITILQNLLIITPCVSETVSSNDLIVS